MEERVVSHGEAVQIANRHLKGLTAEEVPGKIAKVHLAREVERADEGVMAVVYELHSGGPSSVDVDLRIDELRSWAAADLQADEKEIKFWFEVVPGKVEESPVTEA